MRNSLVFIALSGVLGLLAPGCAVSDEPAPQDLTPEHGFTRDATGNAVPAQVSTQDFAPASSFDRSTPVEGAAPEAEPAAVACYGACNSNTCVCTGDLDCCIVGCVLCWQVVNS